MRPAVLVFLFLVTACGYRPVAGGMGPEVSEQARFAPFLVANNSPELAMSHVVGSAARQELGRRGLLADEGEGNWYYLDLTINRFAERPATLAPNGAVVEFFGEMHVSYRVHAPERAQALVTVPSERIWYRYYFNANPQVLEQFRQAAVAEAVRKWVASLSMRTALARSQAAHHAVAATTETTPDPESGELVPLDPWEAP